MAVPLFQRSEDHQSSLLHAYSAFGRKCERACCVRADTAPPLRTVDRATTAQDLLHILHHGNQELKREVDASLKEHVESLLAKASSSCLLATPPAHSRPGRGPLGLHMTLGGKQHHYTCHASCHGASRCGRGGAELRALVGCCSY